ncbi:MAG: hypothetical protein QOK48_1264 [Blastocatellia bacterium]|jgi:hypothetical protein|nr:hypothetical protein [Blastocatellia bacterium]
MPLTEQRQLEMKIAQKFGEYGDVYETGGEVYGLKGMDLRTYFTLGPNPWASIETIPGYFSDEFETRRMEMLLEKGGYLDEYHQALNATGVTLKEATLEQRCNALLEVRYTIPPPVEEPLPTKRVSKKRKVEATPEPAETPHVPDREFETVSEVKERRALGELPDDWWLTYLPDERVLVTFIDMNGEIEKIEATWAYEGNLFKMRQTPLRVNGVSFYDYIEVRWENGDLTPIFERVYKKDGYGTIRINVKGLSRKARGTLIDYLGYSMDHHRSDGDWMVVSYWNDDLIPKLDYRGLDWEVADERAD